MECVTLVNPIGPIGDFIGTVPATIAAAERANAEGKRLRLYHQPGITDLVRALPKRLNIEAIAHHDTDGLSRGHADGSIPADYAFDLMKAFSWCSQREVYQTRYYFGEVGLPIPQHDVRPEFELPPSRAIELDWGLAPFARCLPDEQRWPRKLWQALVDVMPDRSFTLFGQAGVDDPNYVTGRNVVPCFGRSLSHVCEIIRDLRFGLVSVSTGPSHIAYAVGQHNVLLINQGRFCWNPDADAITELIPKIKVGTVRAAMRERETVAALTLQRV